MSDNTIDIMTAAMHASLDHAEECARTIRALGGPDYLARLDLDPDDGGPVPDPESEYTRRFGALRVPEIDAIAAELESQFPGIDCPRWFISLGTLAWARSMGEISEERYELQRWAVGYAQWADGGITLGVGTPRIVHAREVVTTPKFGFGAVIPGAVICGEPLGRKDAEGKPIPSHYADAENLVAAVHRFMAKEYARARQNANWHRPKAQG